MATMTLKKPRSLTISKVKFEKGVPKVVSEEYARRYEDDDRFKIKFDGTVPGAGELAREKEKIKPKAKPDPKQSPDAAERKAAKAKAARIRKANSLLDIDNEDDFTNDGKPTVEALKRITGEDVTAEERDNALAKSDPEENFEEIEFLEGGIKLDEEPDPAGEGDDTVAGGAQEAQTGEGAEGESTVEGGTGPTDDKPSKPSNVKFKTKLRKPDPTQSEKGDITATELKRGNAKPKVEVDPTTAGAVKIGD